MNPEGQKLQYKDGHIFWRSKVISDDYPFILFLHGLGDSSYGFASFLEEHRLPRYNVIIPDLPGCGQSSKIGKCDFHEQVDALIYILKQYEYKNLYVVAHSMGGLHAVMLANKIKVSGICMVESFLTQHGSFVSERLAKAKEEGKNLDRWFENFKEKVKAQSDDPVFTSYYKSLLEADKRPLHNFYIAI